MNKINVSFYLADANGSASTHLSSSSLMYIPQVGSKVFIEHDGYDWSNKVPVDEPSINGLFIVKEIVSVIHDKFKYCNEDIGDSTYKVPSWETKETLEITVVQIEDYKK